MGQYYKVINIDKKEYMQALGGVKLMEWSYNRNLLILNLMNKLANEWKGDRVFVVGDYAVSEEDDDSYDYNKLVEIEKDLDIYQKKSSEGYQISLYGYAYDNFTEISLKKLEKEEYKYIYNHNKKQFIELKHCPLAWLYKDKNTYVQVKVAPISLLLALGNGRGGGDYYGNNSGYVGAYLDDVQNLEITKEKLENDYTEFRPEFYEDTYIPYTKIPEYIKLEQMKNNISKEIVKFLYQNNREQFDYCYNNQKQAIENIEYSFEREAERRMEQIQEIMSKNYNEDVRKDGQDIIEKIKDYLINEAVTNSIDEDVNGNDSINLLYKHIFHRLKIENIKEISTDNSKTLIIFDTLEETKITTNDISNKNEIIENAKKIYDLSKNQKEVICFAETGKKIPKEQRDDNLFYYEYRESEGERTIEKSVWVDYVGTLVTNKEILKGKEFINYEELFENEKIKMLEDSDIAEKINMKDEEEEYE